MITRTRSGRYSGARPVRSKSACKLHVTHLRHKIHMLKRTMLAARAFVCQRRSHPHSWPHSRNSSTSTTPSPSYRPTAPASSPPLPTEPGQTQAECSHPHHTHNNIHHTHPPLLHGPILHQLKGVIKTSQYDGTTRVQPP